MPGNALGQMIARITGRAPSQLRPDSNLQSDLNLSSLERVELMSALEDRYQVDLSEASFSAASTVGDLERMLRGEAAVRVHYHYPRWALRWPVTWIRLLAHYLLLRPVVFLLGWPRIRGRENLVGVNPPVLVVCNHIDDVDLGFVLTALRRRFRHRLAAAAGGESMEALRTPPVGRSFMGKIVDRTKWILGSALLNIFPLPRQAGFRESFQYAGDAVDRAYSVLVFPEGRHTTTGEVLPFRAGGHPCITGPFTIISFAESEAVDVVHADTIMSTVWAENEAESAAYSAFFDRTARLSLAQQDSALLIDTIRQEF